MTCRISHPFPGFTHFCWDIDDIAAVPLAWQGVLKAVKGVYLLVCKETGKQYVGSVKGDENLWGRFLDYARTGYMLDSALLRVYYASCQGTQRNLRQAVPAVETANRVVTVQPENSVLLMADFAGAQFSKDAVTRLKEVTTYDRPYVKRAAWVHTGSLPKVLYEGIKTFSQREFPTFETREQALEFLVQD